MKTPLKFTDKGSDCAVCAKAGLRSFGVNDADGNEIMYSGHESMAPDEDDMREIVRLVNLAADPGKEAFDNWLFQAVCIIYSKGEVDYVGLFMEDADPIPPEAEAYIKQLFKPQAEAEYAKRKAAYAKRKEK